MGKYLALVFLQNVRDKKRLDIESWNSIVVSGSDLNVGEPSSNSCDAMQAQQMATESI